MPIDLFADKKNTQITAQDEAAEWLTCLYSDEASDEEQQKFKAWLNACEANRTAYKALEQLWRDIPLTENPENFALPSHEIAPHEQPHPGWLVRFEEWLAGYWGSEGVKHPLWCGPAAVTLVLISLLIIMPWYLTSARSEPADIYSTAIGEVKTITLSDGSQVTLDGASKLSVLLSKDKRTMRLHQGRAYFAIARDEKRPLDVTTGRTVVSVLGTAFDIRKGPKDIQVSVVEGHVAVSNIATWSADVSDNALHDSPANSSNSRMSSSTRMPRKTLTAGEQVRVSLQGDIESVLTFEVNRGKTWRDGYLIYDDVELMDIVADVNRYRQKPIELATTNLEQLKVTAAFSADKTEALLQGLVTSYPVTIDEDPNVVTLSMHN